MKKLLFFLIVILTTGCCALNKPIHRMSRDQVCRVQRGEPLYVRHSCM